MEKFVLIPYSVYQSQSTLPRRQNMEQKQEKERLYHKNFVFVYSAVNARLKASNKKHIIDLILNSPRIKFSQSDNLILDNRDTNESILDFVCALKRKNTGFPDTYFTILEAFQLPPKHVFNNNAKANDRGT